MRGRPLAFVEQTLAQLEPGRALDVACGKGRHLGLLQAAGWEATGIDRNEETLALAALAAPGANLVSFDVEAEGLPADLGTFDLVLTTFFLYRPLFPALAAAVAPAGHFLLETFHVENCQRRERPRREAFALQPGEARSLVEATGLRVLQTSEAERGDVFTTRLLARRADL